MSSDPSAPYHPRQRRGRQSWDRCDVWDCSAWWPQRRWRCHSATWRVRRVRPAQAPEQPLHAWIRRPRSRRTAWPTEARGTADITSASALPAYVRRSAGLAGDEAVDEAINDALSGSEAPVACAQSGEMEVCVRRREVQDRAVTVPSTLPEVQQHAAVSTTTLDHKSKVCKGNGSGDFRVQPVLAHTSASPSSSSIDGDHRVARAHRHRVRAVGQANRWVPRGPLGDQQRQRGMQGESPNRGR